MNFWIYAIALLAIPAIIISWPFFFGSGRDRFTGAFLFLIIPLAGILMYMEVGTLDAIDHKMVKPRQAEVSDQPHSSQQGQMDEMISGLQKRMAENPDDPEGWLILGRSLKTMQRYAEAETALSKANRLLPDNPMIMVELAEARLFASGQPQISAEDQQLLEAAVAIDPQLQKGLWLLGIAASQQGDDAKAIAIWQNLSSHLDPASSAAQTVAEQISQAQARLGQPVEAPPGVPVNITLSDELDGALPGSATLFVFIQPTGARGMPLAVKRLAASGFPMLLRFNDADLLQPGASLEDFEQLDVSARISMSGVANRAPGDFQSDIVTFSPNSAREIALHIDQRVP